MTGCLKGYVADDHTAGVERGPGRLLASRPILPPVSPRTAVDMVTRRIPVAGMVLGYLALVAILSMAPYWHLAGAPDQSQIMACTDFGGSR